MSACPTYLGLTIFDVGAAAAAAAGDAEATGQTEGQRLPVLVRSDLLIFCPSNFTVNVRLATPPAAAPSGTAALYSVVVRLADSGSSPFDVRLTRVAANVTGGGRDEPDRYTGARRRLSSIPSKIDTQATGVAAGNVLIAIAITGALLIVVHVGRSTARATTSLSGTLFRLY